MATSQTVVVTGVSSFIGVALARHFAGAGYRVVGTATRPAEQYDALRGARLRAVLQSGAELAAVDLCDPAALKAFIEQFRPAVWVHHAGWATNYGHLAYDLDRGHQINVSPLATLYVVLKAAGCRGVLVTGSSAEYSDSDAANREEDVCWPSMPYGLSKLAESVRARQLALEVGLPTRVARVYIPYGSLDAPGKVIPSVVDALRAGKPVELSPCEQSRDFLNVAELARGYAALLNDLQRPEPFDVFNLCSGRAVRLRELLLEVARQLKASPDLLLFGKRAMRPGEPPISFGDNGKAARVLGWTPQPLEEGLYDYLSANDETSR